MYQKLKHLGKRKRGPQSNSEDDYIPREQSNQIIQGSSRLQSAASEEENAPPSVIASAPPLAAEIPSLGLNVLYQPPRTIDPIADIVFVHGLTGDSYTTWRHEQTGVYWPKELLGKDLADARILSFGYDVDVVRFWNPASNNTVSNHAENLLGALSRIRGRTESVSPLSITLQLRVVRKSHGNRCQPADTLNSHATVAKDGTHTDSSPRNIGRSYS